VGIPRALLFYDYAPLLIGYLNALGAKVVLSGQTNNEIIEQSAELSYTDSCFPVKLLHGHAAMLKDVDLMLFPALSAWAKRMGTRTSAMRARLCRRRPSSSARCSTSGNAPDPGARLQPRQ